MGRCELGSTPTAGRLNTEPYFGLVFIPVTSCLSDELSGVQGSCVRAQGRTAGGDRTREVLGGSTW